MSRFAVGMAIALAAALAVGVVVVVMQSGGGIRPNLALILVLTALLTSIVAVAAIAGARRSNRKGPRRGRAEIAANDFDLSYLAKADKSFRSAFGELPELPRNATVKHVMTGDFDGRPITVFESSYMIYTGQTMMQVAYTVYAVDAPDWPSTHITRRNWFGRMALKLGRQPALLLDNPQFNSRFKVRTENDDFAIALLSPEMQAFMLQKMNVRWRIKDGRVCLCYSGTLKPQRLTASLERMRQFWSLVPDELEAW
ncbi:MAG: hypothetical protein IIA64_10635 [Planctomycetes bacterium]|nr:hypothetical protein [Planctomycetota bacterium]